MPETKINYENKEYWDKKSQDYPTLGIGQEDIGETKEIWGYFKYCLKTKNRFFFEHPLLPLIIKHLEKHIFVLRKNTNIYRARIDYDREYEKQSWLALNYVKFQTADMESVFADYYKQEAAKIAESPEYKSFLARYSEGFEGFDSQGSGVPPYDKVSAGRCNPEHVVFLYTANDEHTAVAEVRPYIRDSISIATLSVEKDLQLVDFYYEYDANGYRDIDNIFFDMMRTEFSKLNKGNKEEYLITQFLSSLVLHLGFDGIRFRSSLVEKGANYVIFDAKNCTPISSKICILSKVKYELFSILQQKEKELLNNQL